ncbi:hypothetical protein [Flavobacterium sp. H122]|uniref:hypothetical protein n=1 Tax=Flavobacterium sp. H122 TaxID=2529860 RepID=UPI0010AA340F|nr:hypothetical protein [Flavobacterium sp. H122]
MKKLLTILLLTLSVSLFAQKKFEATNNQTGQTTSIAEGSRVKINTLNRQKFVGEMTIKNAETISVNGNDIAISNISSIKKYPKGGRKLKNILYGVGSGLIVGSGVAGLAKNGSAFALFTGGLGTVITGALVNNKDKALIYRNYTFKITE